MHEFYSNKIRTFVAISIAKNKEIIYNTINSKYHLNITKIFLFYTYQYFPHI